MSDQKQAKVVTIYSSETRNPYSDSMSDARQNEFKPCPQVHLVQMSICELCLAGQGEECHTPGCALFLHNSPGLPINEAFYEVLPKRAEISVSEDKEVLGEKDALDLSTRSGQLALQLLRNASCPACDGSGAIQVQTGSREYVTRDMARDAGDLSMEGSLYRDEEWETQECEWGSQRAMILSEHAPKSD